MKTPEVDYDIFNNHSFHVHCRVDAEILDLYRKAGCKRLVIDYRSSDVEKLAELANAVEVLEIRNDEIANYNFISAFSEIKDLHSSVRLGAVNFGQFKKLKSLSISSQAFDVSELLSSNQLNELAFTGVKLRNGQALKELKMLREFNLVRTSGYDLDVFESLTDLELLGIYNLKSKDCKFLRHCKKLVGVLFALSPMIETLEGLPSNQITELSIRSCKQLHSLKPADAYRKLEKILIESCPKITTLEPLLLARRLKTIIMCERTSIADGRIRRMFDNPNLNRFKFDNRKHYDMKYEDAEKINAARGGNLEHRPARNILK